MHSRPTLFVLATLALNLGVGPVQAVTVVDCKVKDNHQYYGDRCPPDSEKVGEKRLPSRSKKDPAEVMAEAAKENPVVLFSVPGCDACDLVRHQLTTRGIPFTEKDVGSDTENQQALKSLSAGGTTVPTVAVGSRTFTGYSRAALDMGLTEAGYVAEDGSKTPDVPAISEAAPAN